MSEIEIRIEEIHRLPELLEVTDDGFEIDTEIIETTPLAPRGFGLPGRFEFGDRDALDPSSIEQEMVEETVRRMNGLARAIFSAFQIVGAVVLFGLACAAYFEVRS